MDGPRYDGLIEHWKVELIEGCARRMGFPAHEIDDLKQEIVLELIDFKFDKSKSNGAKESTAVQALIMNQLRNKQRGCAREHAKIKRYKQLMPRCDESQMSMRPCELDDVRDAIAGLTPFCKEVALRLINGESRESIRKQLGCSWHTVDRAIRRILEHFQELNPEGWLGK
jgi:RNA polymerase sigma factor (sigma-70 family)